MSTSKRYSLKLDIIRSTRHKQRPLGPLIGIEVFNYSNKSSAGTWGPVYNFRFVRRPTGTEDGLLYLCSC